RGGEHLGHAAHSDILDGRAGLVKDIAAMSPEAPAPAAPRPAAGEPGAPTPPQPGPGLGRSRTPAPGEPGQPGEPAHADGYSCARAWAALTAAHARIADQLSSALAQS